MILINDINAVFNLASNISVDPYLKQHCSKVKLMFHNYDTPQSKSAVRRSFTMDSVSKLDVLLSLAENKNEMKNISQLPLFIYPGDSEYISEETLKF